jgi:mevalonate kinase
MTIVFGDAVSEADPATESSLRRFAEFLADRAPHLPPSRVEITSDLPVSSGFGSSAALCTALAYWSLAAETSVADGTAPQREAWRRAHELEAFFHGTPSGIDTGLVALRGVQAFHFASDQQGGLPAATPLSDTLPPLVVGAIPRGRSTRELVALVRGRREAHRATTEALLSRLGSLTEDAIDLLSGHHTSAEALGRIASTAHSCLADLGVSSPTLDRILQVGIDAGALGGKLSGAGDGGAFYVVCADLETAEAAHAAILQELPPGGVAFRV